MHLIRTKKELATNTYLYEVDAPYVAKARKPGQFLVLQEDGCSGRISPLRFVLRRPLPMLLDPPGLFSLLRCSNANR